MRIVFIGPPGAGKGTQAERLVGTFQMAHLSTGDMLRAARDAKSELGQKAEKYMSAGQLVPDDLIIALIRQRLEAPDCRQGYLLDGFPRTIAQAEALDALFAQRETPLDAVLELQVPEEELFQRLAGRGRADDQPEVIRQRLVAYRRQTAPLLAYYGQRGLLKSIDGSGTVDEVFARAPARRWADKGTVSGVELKSRREIGQMRKAGLLVWDAFQLVRPLVRPGVTTAEIDIALATFFAEHGAEPLFKDYPNSTEGGPPFPAVTCISINREVVHGIPGKRKLVEGDIVSIDTGCRLGGWCGDAAVTLPVGRVDAEIMRLVATTRNVLHLAIDRIGRCKWWSEVAEEMQESVRRAGFSVVEDFVGHGIGRKMHEDPQVPNFVKRGFRRGRNDFELVPGLVIAIEPMVNLGVKTVRMRDQWTQVTTDGQPSAHFEHTVALTEAGPAVLTAGPNGESW